MWSEEIKDKIDQERLKTLRMVKLQRKAQQLNNQNEADAKPDQAASRKRPKVKETPGKKRRGGEQAVEDQQALNGAKHAENKKKAPLPGEGMPPKALLGKRVTENQIEIEIDKEAFIKN